MVAGTAAGLEVAGQDSMRAVPLRLAAKNRMIQSIAELSEINRCLDFVDNVPACSYLRRGGRSPKDRLRVATVGLLS